MVTASDLLLVEDLVALMRRHGAMRVTIGDVTVEMGGRPAPSPALAAGAEMPKHPLFVDDGAGRCACGHHPVIEHNEAGCLLGCSDALCASKIGEPPAEAA